LNFRFSRWIVIFFLDDASKKKKKQMLQLNIDGLELAEEEPQKLRDVLRRWQVSPQA